MISEIDKFLAPLLYRAQLLCGTTVAKDIPNKDRRWKRNTGELGHRHVYTRRWGVVAP